jgi:hypothetical protein
VPFSPIKENIVKLLLLQEAMRANIVLLNELSFDIIEMVKSV